MGPHTISIVVVSYNVCALLQRCLASLPAYAEVIVVDNASDDGSVQMVRAKFAHVQCLALPDNRGFSAAVNHGVAHAQGDAVLLLNPDTQLPTGALMAMAEALGASVDAGAVGFRQTDADGHFQLAVGPRPSMLGELGRKFVQGRLDAKTLWLGRALDWALRRRTQVAWVAGSSLLVWREAFAAVGGFDARYFLYFEDIDFCLRLRAAGYAVYYDPRVTVLHHRGASAAKRPGPAMQAYRHSQALFWRTHQGRLAGAAVAAYAAMRRAAARTAL
jgi:hypothetical protein